MEAVKRIKKITTVHNIGGVEFIMKRNAKEQNNVQRNAFSNEKSKQENARNSQEFGLEQEFSNVRNEEQRQKQQNERANRNNNEKNRLGNK